MNFSSASVKNSPMCAAFTGGVRPRRRAPTAGERPNFGLGWEGRRSGIETVQVGRHSGKSGGRQQRRDRPAFGLWTASGGVRGRRDPVDPARREAGVIAKGTADGLWHVARVNRAVRQPGLRRVRECRRDGKRPRIEDYLRDTSEPGRSALLRCLLTSELETRRQRGERPVPEEYLGRFPADVRAHTLRLRRTALHRRPSARRRRRRAALGRVDPRARGRPLGRWDADRFLGKWIWAWPLIAAAILAIAGTWARATIERVMRNQLASELLGCGTPTLRH